MKIAVSAESSIDLNEELLTKYNIETVPVPVVMGDNTSFDREVSFNDIFKLKDEKGIVSKSSGPNPHAYEVFFEDLEKKYDYIIHIAMSKDMSCSYSNATMAAKKYDNISLIDARSCSSICGLLAMKTRELLDSGTSIEKTCEIIQKRAYAGVSGFIIEDTNYLYHAGRCSNFSRMASRLLRLKPEVYCKTDIGKLSLGKIYKGNIKKCSLKYVDHMLELFNTPDTSLAIITHTTVFENTIDLVKEKLLNFGFKKVLITEAGAAVATNAGPHSFGVIYLNDGNVKY